MTTWEDEVARERDAFLEGLARAGLTVHTSALADGVLTVPSLSRAVPILIEIPDEFPYRPPRVRAPGGDGSASWHREPGPGFWLCLYTEDGSGGLPWADARAFLDRVRDWFEADAAGWPGDPPDLDIERYWSGRVDGLLLYSGLEEVAGSPLIVTNRGKNLFELRIGRLSGGGRSQRRPFGAALVDIGELERPIHDWPELADRISGHDNLERRIAKGTIRFVLVRYSRKGHPAVLALKATGRRPIQLTPIRSADSGLQTLRLRTGLDAGILGESAVAIVGVGAVGGFIAEQLARAGIGRLTLVDGDMLRPGNLVRHVLGQQWIGRNKADALSSHLNSTAWFAGEVEAATDPLTMTAEAATLFSDHDLVVDATASARAGKLLLDGSNHLGRRLLAVCLQRAGGIARIDRSPLGGSEAWLDPVPELVVALPELREGGCGDPVSPTPAWACVHAATVAVAAAVDTLTGRGEYPPTILDVLVAQPDAPYNVLGRVL